MSGLPIEASNAVLCFFDSASSAKQRCWALAAAHNVKSVSVIMAAPAWTWSIIIIAKVSGNQVITLIIFFKTFIVLLLFKNRSFLQNIFAYVKPVAYVGRRGDENFVHLITTPYQEPIKLYPF
jgi:hypothetical protein